MNYQLRDFVQQYGGDENDALMLESFSKTNEERRLERIARIISSDYHVQLKVQYFQGSYSTKQGAENNPYVFISIDPTMVYEKGLSFADAWQRVLGIVAHEAGHIAYTNFNVVMKNGKNVEEKQKQIPVVAKRLQNIYKGNSQEVVEDVIRELKEAITDYVYARNLPTMLNSIEDASVEFAVSGMTPDYYPSLIAVRDCIFAKEMESLKYLSFQMDVADILETLMTEIRQFGVIGYRQTFTPRFLPRFFSPKEIQDMQRLALYGRAAAVDTQERNIISKVLLDMLRPVIEKEADEFLTEYLNALRMDEGSFEDIANQMMNQMAGKPSKLSITGKMDGNLANMTQPQSSSKYNLDLPSDLQDKVNQKKQEETQEDSNGNSSGDGSNSSGESNESDSRSESSSDSTDSNQAGENKEGNSGKNVGEQSEDTSKGKAKNDEENGKGGENTEENSDDSSSCISKNVDEMLSKSSVQKENDRAKDAVSENLKKVQKEFQSKIEKDFAHSVEGKHSTGSGKAPLREGLGNPNSITDAHKGIQTRYLDSKQVCSMGISYEGSRAKRNQASLIQQATQFSRKLKEVLMYQAKTRRKNGLKNGQLHDAALSRIVTDQRVFKKTIQGKEKKARIVVLLDLSGSMSGDKLTNAIQAAYMLAEACAKIKVPVSIMGHDYRRGAVELYHFLEYENYLKKDARENLFCAHSGGCNHDGLAIFHNLTDLVRHRKPNEQLIQLVISDGSPNGEGYYGGDYAIKDIQQIIATFEKQYNTHTIGIGIGNDVSHVSKIYKDYLLVPNVTTLSDELLKVLKSILL